MSVKLEVGEYLLYGLQGVCRLEKIETDETTGEKTLVLQPLFDARSKLYIPANSSVCHSKMRPVLSKEEVMELIYSMPHLADIWIEADSARKERFGAILRGGERKELCQVIKTLHFAEIRKKENGKRLYRIDEKTMKDAKKMLYGEFAHVLGMEFDEVEPFVLATIEA